MSQMGQGWPLRPAGLALPMTDWPESRLRPPMHRDGAIIFGGLARRCEGRAIRHPNQPPLGQKNLESSTNCLITVSSRCRSHARTSMIIKSAAWVGAECQFRAGTSSSIRSRRTGRRVRRKTVWIVAEPTVRGIAPGTSAGPIDPGAAFPLPIADKAKAPGIVADSVWRAEPRASAGPCVLRHRPPRRRIRSSRPGQRQSPRPQYVPTHHQPHPAIVQNGLCSHLCQALRPVGSA